LRIGLLWRAEWDAADRPETARLHGMFAAFAALGVAAEAIVYSDDTVDAIRERLLELDGVLVWVNPIEHGLDRSRLDPLLREVADAGVWVSAHPDVIQKIATKQVLVDTASLSWSADTYLYATEAQLRRELPARLASRGALVLKQERGMGGAGVWKVEPAGEAVRVQHAAGDGSPETLPVGAFVDRCADYFRNGRGMVEQPYQPRIVEGMIRVYLSHDTVVGFAHQYPRGLLPPDAPIPPAGKVFELPSAPRYAALRARMESEWVPELQRITGVDTVSLPVIWDADFLYGSGDETYVLCEINASSTFAFPEHAMPTVAGAALRRIASRIE
jgi:hypothetical protein